MRTMNPTGRIAGTAAEDLFTGVRHMAASTSQPGIDRAERLARMTRAAELARNLHQTAPLLDPYRSPAFSQLVDRAAVAGARGAQLALPGYAEDPAGAIAEARERLELAAQHGQLRGLIRTEHRATDTTGLQGVGIIPGEPVAVSAAAWLNGYAVAPVDPIGLADLLPLAWSAIPAAVINPAAGTGVMTGDPQLDAEAATWTLSGWGVPASRQTLDWSVRSGGELEALIGVVVDHGLEAELLEQLTTGAPTATSIEEAETAVGAAWPGGADLVLVNGEDRPAVVRSYAAAGIHPEDRPRILATAGATAGSAVVMATATVHLAATGIEWLAEPDPAHLGADVAGFRYGRVRARVAGAVQVVTL